MLPKEHSEIYIQSFKHDGSLHRTWSKGYVIEATKERIVAVTDKSNVIEADGRVWVTREPAICFFYPDRWYNVICMIRKTGIYYYCNLASPSIYDGEALKNIDYDLDVKVNPQRKVILVDEDEYEEHAQSMEYAQDLHIAIQKWLQVLLRDIEKQASPFQESEIEVLFQRYLKGMHKETME
ncbi:MAG: DUF402 domain-containing protein [Erysipelotrichaceae bacterium]